jgi:hypothetical protein
MQLPATPKNHGKLRRNKRRVGAEAGHDGSPPGQLEAGKRSDRKRPAQHPSDQSQIEKQAASAVLTMHDPSFMLPTSVDASHDRAFMQSLSRQRPTAVR